ANGRIDIDSFGIDFPISNPRLYSIDITLSNGVSPVTSVDFNYSSGAGHAAIMALSGSTGGNFNPISITGYNRDIVIEATAGKTGVLATSTTASMDSGTANTQFTWYEKGYIPTVPTSGLPAAGSIITN